MTTWTIGSVHKKLCEAWNTNQGRVYGRLKRKLSVEDTLTLPPNHTPTAIACVDPLGRHFNSKNEMYAACGTNKDEFWHRVNIKKMSPEQALMYERPKYMDYEGKVFKSKNAMCEAHSTTTGRYDYRIRNGATLEYALGLKCIAPESMFIPTKKTLFWKLYLLYFTLFAAAMSMELTPHVGSQAEISMKI